MTIDAEELGRSLRMVRNKRGLKLREIADAVGVTVNYIWLIENGQRKPSVGALNKGSSRILVGAA
jgi:transcriptional regulator with XRE-family HTH domain